MKSGFIPLSRKYFLSDEWLAVPFSPKETWIDLLQLAHFDQSEAVKKLSNGKEITIERGQLVVSLRSLAKRWGWGVKAVKTQLGKQERKQQLTQDTQQGITIITITNYDRYNPLLKQKETAKETAIYMNKRTNLNNELKKEKIKKENLGGVVELPFDENSPTMQLVRSVITDTSVCDAIRDYVRVRFDNGTNINEIQIKKHLENLIRLSTESKTQLEIINEATLRNWGTFYPIDRDKNNPKKTNHSTENVNKFVYKKGFF
jgi:hypothetical protein